jgi:hypothetical protein
MLQYNSELIPLMLTNVIYTFVNDNNENKTISTLSFLLIFKQQFVGFMSIF